MKYLSLVILLVLMIWSWSLATSERPFKLEQHKQVEAGVEDDIRAFIKRKYPMDSELVCPQLYTEIVKPNEVMIAHFRCVASGTATSGAAEQVFEGYLNLKSDDNFETWSETGGQIRSPEIRFKDGMHITRDKNPSGASDASGANDQGVEPKAGESHGNETPDAHHEGHQ